MEETTSFKCTLCGDAFVCQPDLLLHLRSRHSQLEEDNDVHNRTASGKIFGADIMEKRKSMGDFHWSVRPFSCISYKFLVHRTPRQIKEHVYQSQRVQFAISQFSEESGQPRSDVEAEAISILEEMGHNYQLRTVRGFGFVLSKLMKQLYTGVYVNEDGIAKLRAVVPDYPILLMPTHRSYVDFLLLSYVCFLYDLPLPVIAAGIDFMGMKVVNTFLRNAGAFFIRRSFGHDRLYWSIFSEYVQTHIVNGDAPIEFFVEGTRSRTAKSLAPKLGFLASAVEPFFKSEVTDIAVVPISMNYDRTLEELLYSYELLGVPKPKESTQGLIKARQILDDCFGTIHVHISDPIIVSEFCKSMSVRRVPVLGPRYLSPLSAEESQVCKALAYRAIREHQLHGVLSPFTLVASVMLVSIQVNNSEIMIQQMADELEWLHDVLCALGGRVAWKRGKSTEQIIVECARVHNSSVRIIKGTSSAKPFIRPVKVQQRGAAILLKKSKDLKGHQLSSETLAQAVPCMLLAHYSNQLLHVLVRVALVAFCVHSGPSEGCTKAFIMSKYKFLEQLLSHDFIFEPGFSERDCSESLESLQRLGLISHCSDLITTESSGHKLYSFFCQLFDPFLIGYRVVCQVLLNLGNHTVIPSCTLVVREAQACVERLLQSKHVTQFVVLSLDLLNNAVLGITHLGGLRREKRNGQCVLQCVNHELNKIKSELDLLIHLPEALINAHLEPLLSQPLAKL